MLYSIRNLICSYNGVKTVLEIKQLDIPNEKIVFFVGPSGIGKSTILETLGFMTRTIIHDKEEFLYKGIDVSNKWNLKDKELSQFRMNEFSFVFQQNNLMPNFTAYENIVTPALFQGMDLNIARKETRKILDQIGLPTEDRRVSEYSGGQRQRLALARAILPKFSVLFADEPTGNLDSANADKLMKLIVDSVMEKKSTAIIVSHDISLSIKYADMIVNMKRDEQKSHGVIDNTCIYLKEGNSWKNISETISDNDLYVLLNTSLRNERN